jgi:hypothetical protein
MRLLTLIAPTTLGIYGHPDQRDLERWIEALAEPRAAEETASRGTIRPPGSTESAICRNDGGGGNRTRVRGRS